MKSKKIQPKNETIDQLYDSYASDFINMEDSYYELTGKAPGWKDTEFWDCPAVKKVDTLLHLFWDLKDFRGGKHEQN